MGARIEVDGRVRQRPVAQLIVQLLAEAIQLAQIQRPKVQEEVPVDLGGTRRKVVVRRRRASGGKGWGMGGGIYVHTELAINLEEVCGRRD